MTRELRGIHLDRSAPVDATSLEALLTADPQACWRAWIQSIAHNPEMDMRRLMDHIQLHVGKHMPNHDAPPVRWEQWIAGTYNLLAILGSMTDIVAPHELGIELLYRKWASAPSDHTPPPAIVQRALDIPAGPPAPSVAQDDWS
jgi:hypothetical protein